MSQPDSPTSSKSAAKAVEGALGITSPASLRPATVKGSLPAESDSRDVGRGVSGAKPPYRARGARILSPPRSASSVQAALLSNPPPSSPDPVVHRSVAGSASSVTAHPGARDVPAASDLDGQVAHPGMRTPVRSSVSTSGLETVEEGSLPSTPSADLALQFRSMDRHSLVGDAGNPSDGQAKPDGERTDGAAPKPPPDDRKPSASSGQRKPGPAANMSAHVTRSNALPSSSSSSSSSAAPHPVLKPQSKTGPEGAIQSMTVETETVSSVPQVAVGGGAGERGTLGRGDGGGSLRMRPSLETVRPRRDRKKTTRKTPSLATGAGTTKADIFEAKVASAVDEANSTDSDETFVYESNPPEPHPPRPVRHHSRTPSTTSVQSQMEQRAALLANPSTLAGKRSMKFASNSYVGPLSDQESGFDAPAFVRGSGRGSGHGHGHGGGQTSAHHLHHHIGHWGRAGRGTQGATFDAEPLFVQGIRSARTAANSRQSSRATSPRDRNPPPPLLPPHPPPPAPHLGPVHSKKGGRVSTYDIDVESVDDESTPLMSTTRGGRRRSAADTISRARYRPPRPAPWLARLAGCLALTTIILLIIVGAVGFFAATAKPLVDLRLLDISNVIATREELMLDTSFEAVNPNIVSVSVEYMDVNVFAKSKRSQPEEAAEGQSAMVSSRLQRPSRPRTSENIDEGTDPVQVEDPDADSHAMLLGQIFHFDSVPTFEGSPLAHRPSVSTGEARLWKPGNDTEDGGTARWERILQHPFELIVRGVLKYQLPLSGLVRTAPIGGTVLVHPELGVDSRGTMLLEHPHGQPDNTDGSSGRKGAYKPVTLIPFPAPR